MASEDRENVQVVVIGAGIAGLSVTEQLYRNGYTNIVLLEAKNRIGGRIYSESFGKGEDGYVEMGAQHIGGIRPTCSSYLLANEAGLEINMDVSYNLFRYTDVGFVHKSDGGIIEPSLITRVNAHFINWLDMWGKVVEEVTIEKHLTEFIETTILPEFSEKEAGDVRCYTNFYKLWLMVGEGLPLTDWVIYDDPCITTPQPEVKGRLDGLVQEVASRFPDSMIQLNSPVTGIKWEQSGSDRVVVTCTENNEPKVYEADHVVVTCPLGFLKRNHESLFQPKLPEEKIAAIKKIPFGNFAKVFFEFEKPFWDKNVPIMRMGWTDDEFKCIEGKWTRRLYALWDVASCDNVLGCGVATEGVSVMENLSDEQIKDDVTELLRIVTNNPSVPRPSRVLKTNWATDPYTLGVYSARGKATDADRDALTKPLAVEGTPRVLFAGEATENYSMGYMHSARDSGLRAACDLISYYNK